MENEMQVNTALIMKEGRTSLFDGNDNPDEDVDGQRNTQFILLKGYLKIFKY